MNTEDAKYQPEEQGYKQYVPNPWNCSEKSVHHNLQERANVRFYRKLQTIFTTLHKLNFDSHRQLSLALFP